MIEYARSLVYNAFPLIVTRDEFGKVMSQHFFLRGLGVEVGVFKGDFAKVLRSGWTGNLYLVDRWQHVEGYNDISNVSNEMFAAMYRNLKEYFQYDAHVLLVTGESYEVAQNMKDSSFDWVYLDGDHSALGVMRDLFAWYPKVRAGGVMAGHDYIDGRLSAGDFAVKSVVDLFADFLGVTVHQTQEIWPTWFFVKPLD